MERVGLGVWYGDGVLDYGGHEGVVDHDDPASCRRKRVEEGGDGFAEEGGGGEGWLEMRREFGGGDGGGVWLRRKEVRCWEFMEVDLVGGRREVVAVDAESSLANVGGEADVVDGDVVGGDEAGEVEELVEMALCRKRYHHHRDLWLF